MGCLEHFDTWVYNIVVRNILNILVHVCQSSWFCEHSETKTLNWQRKKEKKFIHMTDYFP
jgi:hypothetical protein